MENSKDFEIPQIVALTGIEFEIDKEKYRLKLNEAINECKKNPSLNILSNNNSELVCPITKLNVKISELKFYFPSIETELEIVRKLQRKEIKKQKYNTEYKKAPDKVSKHSSVLTQIPSSCYFCNKSCIEDKIKCQNTKCQLIFHNKCLMEYFLNPNAEFKCPKCKISLIDYYRLFLNQGNYKDFYFCHKCNGPIKKDSIYSCEDGKHYYHQFCFEDLLNQFDKMIQNRCECCSKNETICLFCKKNLIEKNNDLAIFSFSIYSHKKCLFNDWLNKGDCDNFYQKFKNKRKINPKALSKYKNEYDLLSVCEVCRRKIIGEKELLQIYSTKKNHDHFHHKECQIYFCPKCDEYCHLCRNVIDQRAPKKIVCAENDKHIFHNTCFFIETVKRYENDYIEIQCPLCMGLLKDFNTSEYLQFKERLPICKACLTPINLIFPSFKIGENVFHEKCNPFKIQSYKCCKCKNLIKYNCQHFILLSCLHIIHLECIEAYFQMGKESQESDKSLCKICNKNSSISKYIYNKEISINMEDLIIFFKNYLIKSKLNKNQFLDSKIEEFGFPPSNNKISVKVLLLIRNNFEIFELYYQFSEKYTLLNLSIDNQINFSCLCHLCMLNLNEIELFIIDETIKVYLCTKCVISFLLKIFEEKGKEIKNLISNKNKFFKELEKFKYKKYNFSQ